MAPSLAVWMAAVVARPVVEVAAVWTVAEHSTRLHRQPVHVSQHCKQSHHVLATHRAFVGVP